MNEERGYLDRTLIAVWHATSVATREAVYALRYRVSVLEKGDVRYADTARRRTVDVDDEDRSVLLITEEDDAICGACRMTWLRGRPFVGHNRYRFPRLAARLGVCLKRRRRGVYRNLLTGFQQSVLASGGGIGVAAYRVGDVAARTLLLRSGWKRYGAHTQWSGERFQNMYQVIS